MHSDNESKFTSAEFVRFAKELDFYHTIFSLGHQQSIGKAEASAKIIKRLMRRAYDPYLALLEYCSTPMSGMTTSPAERMFGHATCSILPISSALGVDNMLQEIARSFSARSSVVSGSFTLFEPKVLVHELLGITSWRRQPWNHTGYYI